MGILDFVFKTLTSNVFEKITKIVSDLIVESKKAEVSQAEIESKVKSGLMEAYGEAAKSAASVRIADAKGEDWLQRNWRGLLGLLFGGVFLFWAVIVPSLVAWAGVTPPRVGDLLLSWIFTLTSIALGGGIGGGIVIELAKIWRK